MKRRIGVCLSYLMIVLEILSTIFLTPFIIRNLGQAEYGIYKLSAAIVSYLLLLDLGVGNAVVRYIAKYRAENDEEKSRKFLGVSTIYYSLVAILSVVIGILLVAIYPSVFAKGLTNDEIVLGQKLLSVTIVTSAITLGTAGFSNTINAYERFEISKGLGILQILLRICLIIVALKMGLGSIGIVLVNLVITLLLKAFNVLYVLLKLKLRPLFKNIEFRFILEIIAYSSFILLQMIATQINAFADEIMLGAFVAGSSIIVGIYGVGHQVVDYFNTLGSAFTGVLMPGLVRMVEEKSSTEKIQKEMTRIGRIIFIVLAFAWCGFLVVGKEFVCAWVGDDYIDSYFVALILSSVYVFIITENVGAQILWAMNKHKEQSVVKFCIVIVNVFLTYLLIKWNPLIGATIGTAIALFLGDIVTMNIVFKKSIGFKMFTYYKNLLRGILPCLFLSVITGFLMKLIPVSGWIQVVAIACGMSCIYVISLTAFGFNKSERLMLRDLLHRIFKKNDKNV